MVSFIFAAFPDCDSWNRTRDNCLTIGKIYYLILHQKHFSKFGSTNNILVDCILLHDTYLLRQHGMIIYKSHLNFSIRKSKSYTSSNSDLLLRNISRKLQSNILFHHKNLFWVNGISTTIDFDKLFGYLLLFSIICKLVVIGCVINIICEKEQNSHKCVLKSVLIFFSFDNHYFNLILIAITQWKMSFLNEKCLFLNEICLFLYEKCLFLYEKCLFLIKKCLFLNKKCLFLNEKCLFLNEKMFFLNEKCLFLNEKCLFLNEKVLLI